MEGRHSIDSDIDQSSSGAHYNVNSQPTVEYDQRYRKSSSNTKNSTNSNTSSNMSEKRNRSSVRLAQSFSGRDSMHRPPVNKSTTRKDLVRSVAVTNVDDAIDEISTTSHDVTAQQSDQPLNKLSKSFHRSSSSRRSLSDRGNVLFGKVLTCCVFHLFTYLFIYLHQIKYGSIT